MNVFTAMMLHTGSWVPNNRHHGLMAWNFVRGWNLPGNFIRGWRLCCVRDTVPFSSFFVVVLWRRRFRPESV